MAYSLEEMRKLRGAAGSFRKLELKAGDPKKIWIPKFLVTYHRKHSKIKQITSFKSARGDYKDCLNQNYGEKGKGCPIEEETQLLWEAWKKAKADNDEVLMKKILTSINDLTSEEFYLNVIDIKDAEKRYFGTRFTPAAYKELEAIDSKYGIDNVIITFSKTENPTRYALTAEDDRPDLIKELKGQLDFFDGRDEPDGGPVDLDKHLIRTYTLADYNSWLTSGEVVEGSSDDSLETPPTSDKKQGAQFSKPKDKPPVKDAKKAEVTDDVIPLDDLDAPPETKTKPPVKETKKEEVISDLDNVPDLDNLDLDNLEKEEKMVKLDSKAINDKRAEKEYIGKIYDYLLKEKKIEASADYKSQLLACYNYVKGKGSVDFPESVFK